VSKVVDVLTKTVPGLIGLIVDGVRRRRARKRGEAPPIPTVKDRRDEIARDRAEMDRRARERFGK
jgi:hypothetical protein